MDEELVEFLIKKYIKSGYIIGIGTSDHAEKFLTKLAAHKEKGLEFSVVPTSTHLAGLITTLGLKISNLSD